MDDSKHPWTWNKVRWDRWEVLTDGKLVVATVGTEVRARRIVAAVNHADALAEALKLNHGRVIFELGVSCEDGGCGVCTMLAAYDAAKAAPEGSSEGGT